MLLYVLWVCSVIIGSSSIAEENRYNFNIEPIIAGSFKGGLFIEWDDAEVVLPLGGQSVALFVRDVILRACM